MDTQLLLGLSLLFAAIGYNLDHFNQAFVKPHAQDFIASDQEVSHFMERLAATELIVVFGIAYLAAGRFLPTSEFGALFAATLSAMAISRFTRVIF